MLGSELLDAGTLALVGAAVAALGLLALGVSWFTPAAFLRRRLRPFFEANGLTVPRRNAKGATLPLYPEISGRRRTGYGYRFEVALPTGKGFEHLARLAGVLADSLRVREVRVMRARPGVGIVEAYKRDSMPAAFGLDAFRSLAATVRDGGLWLPVGKRDDGTLYRVGIGHLLIVGATGSGKGSGLWSVIHALDPLRSRGLVVLYGIDPKRAELAGVGGGFERVEHDHAGAVTVLEQVVAVMDERKAEGLRAFAATPARPWLVLVLDEFNGLLNDPDTARRKRIEGTLHTILSQGRSLGVIVVAAAQNAQKESLGQLRTHFQTRIALRVETATDVDLVLGAGSAEAGARAHEIPPATESNGYATAGVAYARSDGEPVPVRFRFPRITDDDIRRWAERNRA